jgi:hypothetical protein
MHTYHPHPALPTERAKNSPVANVPVRDMLKGYAAAAAKR